MDIYAREHPAKRRKVRKGTRSCWECKGRKVRCIFSEPGDGVCDGCFRRGTKCVSQEMPEQPLAPVDRRRQMGNRMVRVETLIEKLVQGAGDKPSIASVPESLGSGSHEVGGFGPQSPPVGQSHSTTQDTSVAATPVVNCPSTISIEKLDASKMSKYEEISANLLATLPSQEGVDVLVKTAGPIPSYFHQLLLRKPFHEIRLGEKEKSHQVAELTTRYTSKTHPLITVRQMLLLAISFRYIHPEFQSGLEGFPDSPVTTMRRIADAAITLLTTNDGMVRNLEGIECLLLAASIQADSGHIRAGWSTIRRAMLTAQLICLHRQNRPPVMAIEPDTQWDPQFLWYRIVYYDRFYSLILGLPQGSTDTSMGVPSKNDTPMSHLEKRHCVLASRLLQRNEGYFGADDINETHVIDKELQQLSELMPSKWWLVPNLASIRDSDQLLSATVRLTNQLFHYILLSHLHIPYILHSCPEAEDHHRSEYSRMACINASRDLLIRYMALRSFNSVSYCCHSMDFFAITASMTLILAHLDGHCSKNENDKALAHQRTSDRAIMEEILDNMEQVGTLHETKTMSERGASVLRQLLAIEADAAQGSAYRLRRDDGHSADVRALRLSIPYYGIITMSQENQVSADAQETRKIRSSNTIDLAENPQPEVPSQNNRATALPKGQHYETPNTTSTAPQQQQDARFNNHNMSKHPISPISSDLVSEIKDFTPSIDELSGDYLQTQSFSQDPMMGQGDWALQDGDLTFFEALLRQSDTQTEFTEDYWWLT